MHKNNCEGNYFQKSQAEGSCDEKLEKWSLIRRLGNDKWFYCKKICLNCAKSIIYNTAATLNALT